jgi:hypothetical protein
MFSESQFGSLNLYGMHGTGRLYKSIAGAKRAGICAAT